MVLKVAVVRVVIVTSSSTDGWYYDSSSINSISVKANETLLITDGKRW